MTKIGEVEITMRHDFFVENYKMRFCVIKTRHSILFF